MTDNSVPDPGPIVVPDGTYDGDRIAMVFAAEGFAERDTAFEPSLLPQLARLCHDFSLPDVSQAAGFFGREWPQIGESTMRTLADRFDWSEFEWRMPGFIDEAEHAVYRCVARAGLDLTSVDSLITTGDDARAQANRRARLLLVDPSATRLADVLDAGLDPADFEAEPARAIVAAASLIGTALPAGWVEAALGDGEGWFDTGRVAHILPALAAGPDRTARADAIATLIVERGYPVWHVALAISRLGALVSSDAVWQLESMAWLGARWRWHLQILAGAPAAATLAEDVHRSHPFSDLLAGIGGPHETTGPIANEMGHRWGPKTAAMAPPDPEPAPGRSPDPGTGTTGDQRRFGVDVFHDGTLLQRAMVADRVNTITVSYAVAATAQVGAAGSVEFVGTDRRVLPVILVDTSPHLAPKDQVTLRGEIKIRKDPTSSADMEFDVTPRGSTFSAFIAVLAEDGATVIQAASMSASVAGSVADAQAAATTIRLDPVPVSSWHETAAAGAAAVGSVIHDGTAAVVATGSALSPLPAGVTTALALIENVGAGFKTAASNAWATGDRTLIRPTLVGAARSGYKLRSLLGLEAFDGIERIQVVSTSAETILPLELVYAAKRAPSKAATVCETWLSDGSCTTCANLPGAQQMSTVCPSLFWGLSKIIEHHGPAAAPAGSTADFSVRVIHEPGSKPLPAPHRALLAMSELVVKELKSPVGGIAADIRSEVNGLAVEPVADWDAWVAAVDQITPDLLIAMPHNETDHAVGGIIDAALEIGGTFESIIEETHVRPASSSPGPLVVLIGCDTGVDDAALASFAAQFRRFAPVVIATFGEIIAAEAPHVVTSILAAIEREAHAGGTVGAALRTVRQRLLHDHRLAGLQLVVHGQSTWPLEP